MRIHVTGLFVILAACGGSTRMLHEMDSYAGVVELSGAGGGTITGRVTFDRASRNLQFQLRDPEVVSLVRDSSGELRAFAGERWRAPSDAETAVFDLVEAAVSYRPENKERPMAWEDGYKITVAGRELRVRMLEEAYAHTVR